ncbi:hypothetical protein [Nonomuraea sp. B5E05]|uniref:hypothetical protein n=1 Tax=Nonomuraea sp. B5E05 TaxID=3153569 RepID=UPI0032611A0F
MNADEVLAVHNGSAAEGVPVWIDGGQEARCIAAAPTQAVHAAEVGVDGHGRHAGSGHQGAERDRLPGGEAGRRPGQADQLLGVAALGEPDLLVEIEATAVLD